MQSQIKQYHSPKSESSVLSSVTYPRLGFGMLELKGVGTEDLELRVLGFRVYAFRMRIQDVGFRGYRSGELRL